jgi:tRNA pseudouridine65 synthase
LLQAKILTGRRHQIRGHLKYLHHSIIACPKYGKSTHNRFFANIFDVPCPLLHSYRLILKYPLGGQSRVITAKPRSGFKSLM